MKKILLLAALIASVYCTNAQINKGQWLAGGNAGFAFANNSSEPFAPVLGTKSTHMLGAINSGYFIFNRFCVGLRGAVTTSKDVEAGYMAFSQISGGYQYSNSSKSTVWGLGPFIRYYFLPAANKINILADVGCAYNGNAVKDVTVWVYDGGTQGLPGGPFTAREEDIQQYKYNTIGFTAAAGPAFFVNGQTSIEFLVGYTAQTFSGAVINRGNYLIVSAGIQMHLGKKA